MSFNNPFYLLSCDESDQINDSLESSSEEEELRAALAASLESSSEEEELRATLAASHYIANDITKLCFQEDCDGDEMPALLSDTNDEMPVSLSDTDDEMSALSSDTDDEMPALLSDTDDEMPALL